VRVWGLAVALYEIRTLKTQRRTSLLSRADYPDDVSAIMAARGFVRRGETVEVWRDEKLIYRTVPRSG
jgi:hypothetical protein